jgi:hypothetical protein
MYAARVASHHLGLVAIGLGKVAFGLLVGVVGIFSASRVLGGLLKAGRLEQAVKDKNAPLALLHGAGILSLGLLAQHAVAATFSAMDLLYRGHDLHSGMLLRFAFYGVVHVGLSLVVGTVMLAIGAKVFDRLTPGVDEVDEMKKGNLASAIGMAAVLVVLAMMTSPGLQTALDGLLPLPTIGQDEYIAPGANAVDEAP